MLLQGPALLALVTKELRYGEPADGLLEPIGSRRHHQMVEQDGLRGAIRRSHFARVDAHALLKSRGPDKEMPPSTGSTTPVM